MDSEQLTGFIAAELSSFFPANEAAVPSLLAEELRLDKPADAWSLPDAGTIEEEIGFSFAVICLATVAKGSGARSQSRLTEGR